MMMKLVAAMLLSSSVAMANDRLMNLPIAPRVEHSGHSHGPITMYGTGDTTYEVWPTRRSRHSLRSVGTTCESVNRVMRDGGQDDRKELGRRLDQQWEHESGNRLGAEGTQRFMEYCKDHPYSTTGDAIHQLR